MERFFFLPISVLHFCHAIFIVVLVSYNLTSLDDNIAGVRVAVNGCSNFSIQFSLYQMLCFLSGNFRCNEKKKPASPTC